MQAIGASEADLRAGRVLITEVSSFSTLNPLPPRCQADLRTSYQDYLTGGFRVREQESVQRYFTGEFLVILWLCHG